MHCCASTVSSQCLLQKASLPVLMFRLRNIFSPSVSKCTGIFVRPHLLTEGSITIVHPMHLLKHCTASWKSLRGRTCIKQTIPPLQQGREQKRDSPLDEFPTLTLSCLQTDSPQLRCINQFTCWCNSARGRKNSWIDYYSPNRQSNVFLFCFNAIDCSATLIRVYPLKRFN